MASEEQASEEGEYQSVEDSLPRDMVQYRVRYSHARNTEKFDFKEDISKKRCPAGRPGACRLKRVVSCKRKTHRLAVARRKQAGPCRAADTAGRQDQSDPEEDQIFHMDPWELPTASHPGSPGQESSRNTDYFTEMSRDHSAMIEVLFSRNLRLTVAMTLWRRNVGEFLTYLVRIQDTAVFVDCLPIITESIKEESPLFSIGCCVDLLPLVRTALTSPYEGYLTAGLSWLESVLKTRWKDLAACGCSGTGTQSSDRNIQIFKQQILDMWTQEACWTLAPGAAGAPGVPGAAGAAGAVAAVIHTYLSHLSHLP
ncbi:KATNB1-like protein 1 isoform X2 [Osmerus eperlanus]